MKTNRLPAFDDVVSDDNRAKAILEASSRPLTMDEICFVWTEWQQLAVRAAAIDLILGGEITVESPGGEGEGPFTLRKLTPEEQRRQRLP